MIELDAATVLLQWSVGGLFFLWVTTRRREVGIGYGWTMRITYGLMAAGGVVVGLLLDTEPVREAFGAGVVAVTAVALGVSVVRRRAGVAGQRDEEARRTARVAAMTGIDREAQRFDRNVPEFPPVLDLVAPVLGLVALVAAGIEAGDPALLALARTLVGALFLGAVSDAMLLGHWYLVQPGLARAPILELVRWTAILWPFELLVLVWPTGMLSVLSGTIDDGYGGMLGWFWAASAVATILLVGATRAALRERQYSAVMAATGLLYLAILTAFGMDLVARATLA
ncbi:MAG: hypothetical protein CL459_02800 [Acidimicrobiaceae bacterium]|nr:hypothetical protein [Acidimicrobiaceae bacterium]|tara:strand:- start:2274 stop:3125 length:852 start_codon:yes stop_codon:yes gene_type:complete